MSFLLLGNLFKIGALRGKFMHIKNKLFFLPWALLGILTSCGEAAMSSATSERQCNPITDEELIEQLTVIDGDEIYGNIYLPTEIDGTEISWKSSDPSVISDKQIDEMAPGVVHRKTEDTEIKLTASIEGEGGVCYSYTQTVNVKGLEREIQDEDYVGYLFGHFISEDGRTENGEKVAVGEQMYFAFADAYKGLHFKDLSTKNNPILSSVVGERGVRDPFMMRSPEGDRFFIVATDLSVYTRGGWGQNQNDKFSRTGSHAVVFWESHDLINWSESRLLDVAPEDAGMAWAPEMIYHEETGQYVIFFASCLVNEDRSVKTEKDAIYFVTTRDFVHISEPRLLINNQPEDDGSRRIVIDASIIRVGDTYYSAVKDGDNNVRTGGILIQKTQDLFDYESWEKIMDLDDTGLLMPDGRSKPTNMNLEGPEWFVYNQNDRINEDEPEYGLMGDQYMNQGAGYLPFATTDIEDVNNEYGCWRVLTAGADADYSWDSLTKRHGTIMRLTEDECERIRDYYNLDY